MESYKGALCSVGIFDHGFSLFEMRQFLVHNSDFTARLSASGSSLGSRSMPVRVSIARLGSPYGFELV